jgi:hypothetical protein
MDARQARWSQVSREDADAVKAALAALGPVALVERLGLGERPRRSGGGVMIRCPWHDERSPSCSVRVARDGEIVSHCFGCGQSGDALALVAAARALDVRRDFRRVLAEAADIAHVTLEVPTQAAPLPRVNAGEVEGLWAACGAVYDDCELAAALRRRGLEPADVTDRDLARALPARALPRWARFARKSWGELGNRLIVPMYDAGGRLASLHARYIGDEPRDLAPKGLSPLGGRIAGTIMADALGRTLLASREAPAFWAERVVLIEEGVPDFLTVATHYGDDENAPAVLGVLAGSWTREIATRIPDACRVVVRTHTDSAGAKYAAAIGSSLIGRCEVFRPEVTI